MTLDRAISQNSIIDSNTIVSRKFLLPRINGERFAHVSKADIFSRRLMIENFRRERVQEESMVVCWCGHESLDTLVMIISASSSAYSEPRIPTNPLIFLFFFYHRRLNICHVTALDVKRRINCVTLVQKSETLRLY